MKKEWLSLVLILFPGIVFAQGVDAIQMLTNLSQSYPALWKMITGACYLIGFSLALRGIYYLKNYGELRTMTATQTSLKIPATLFIVAGVFMYIPSAFQIINATFFGSGSVLSYDQVSSSISPLVLKAIAGIVQLIGLLSFIKGWMILVAHAQQPGGQATMGKALTHIIGGLLAINILAVADVIWNTFGFKFSL